ncbi:MAG TPA: phasin family protein [Sphingomicrobium sp.]|nr:phasin family protein [Sphingomicrobium sp.]
MSDQTKTENQTEALVKAAQAPAKGVADAIDAAAKPAGAKAVAARRAAKAKTAVRARKARKAPAKVVAAVKQVRRQNAKPARRIAKAAAAATATSFDRTQTMTNDYNQLFTGFQIPGNDKFQGLFANVGARGQEIAAKSQKATEEVTELTKANVEALVEAGRIVSAGAKSIGQDVLASSRSGLEQASEAVKTLADAKSPTEFFQLQSEMVRASFDRFVSESSKLTEQVVKLAGETIQPISNRASVNAERVNELMA